MKRTQVARKGFSLVEVIVAVAVGSVIIGAGMLMYLQGNKYFYKVTEHTSFRAEAILIHERIAEDLLQLQIDTGKNPNTNEYWLVQPYELEGTPSTLNMTDSDGNVIGTVKAGNVLRFPRFHHVEMSAPTPELPNGMPKMVAYMMEYKTEPVDSADPSKGINLLRNGERVNQIPLKEVLFHAEPAIVAANQVQGSPSAILTAKIVPLGGTFGNLDLENLGVLDRLAEQGDIVTRTYHLVGYESFYTSVLFSGLQSGNSSGYENLSDLEAAVVNHARQNAPPQMFANVNTAASGGGGSSSYLLPKESFSVEYNRKHDDTVDTDQSWLAKPVVPGRASGSGPWEGFSFEDNGAGPGSGSGSSGSANASGSGSSNGSGSG